MAGAAQTVQHVEVTQAKGQVNVHVIGDNLPEPKQILWNQTNGITLEWNADLVGKGDRIPIASNDVTAVWYGWFSAHPKKIRVKVQADKAVTSVVKKAADGWTISVGGQTSPAVAQTPTETKPVTALKDVDQVPPINSKQAQDNFWKAAGTPATPAAKPKATTVAANWTTMNPVVVPDQQLKKVSLDVSNGDLAQVLKMLAMESGANIIIGPSVSGKVTATLHDVGIDQALQYIAQITGVHYTKVDGTYVFIGPKEMESTPVHPELQTVNKIVVVVPLMSGNPDQVKMAIQSTAHEGALEVYTPAERALSTGGANPQVGGAPPAAGGGDSNTKDESYLLLVGTARAVHAAEDVAHETDDMIVQARNRYNHREDIARSNDELIAYNVKFADPRALAEDLMSQIPSVFATVAPNSASAFQIYSKGEEKKSELDFLKASNGNASGLQQSTSATSNGAGSTGATNVNQVNDADLEQPFAKEEAAAVPMRLLLRGPHEEIQEAMKMLELMDVAPRQIALEMRVMMLTKEQALNAGIDWSILTGGAVKVINLNNSYTTPSNTISASLTGHNFNGDVTASLDAISDHNNLIARPNIVAMDGRQSEIFVGDIVRYIESIQASQNGTTVTTGEVPVGVRLSVLPRIGAGGNITLDVRPRISILDSFTQVPGGGELPQTSTRFAQSTLNIKSGETLAIGGLIQDQDVKNATGIPFLMDLPIIGHLFKQTSNTRTRTELVIFLTARAIDGPVRADGAAPLPMQPDLKFGAKVGN